MLSLMMDISNENIQRGEKINISKFPIFRQN